MEITKIRSSQFQNFILANCDRKKFIVDYLYEKGIESAILNIKGRNHIYVKFPLNQYNKSYKIKTVIAHYDRVRNSPGANDNSSAVFSLLEWAVELFNKKTFHNIRLIFTDGEENTESLNNQGAFEIASLYRKLNLINDDVFVFDCMGRGTIPVMPKISFSTKVTKESPSFISKYKDLEKRAQKIISIANNGKWYSLPFNFSDNASFMANGIPAVQISLLPEEEIQEVLKGNVPMTWKLIHTKQDDFNTLMNESFYITKKILKILENSKFSI